jgi:arabinan endo-1,5-alpha-L-arabinosidase
MIRKNEIKWLLAFCFLPAAMPACKKAAPAGPVANDTVATTQPATGFDISSMHDTYEDVAPFTYYTKWGPYNVHDPTIRKFGDTYYCYSTDVAFGTPVRPGIQVRKSKDLVQWTYVGWVFDALPAQGAAFISQRGGTPNSSLWAPYIMKVGSEYRLYYSLSSNLARLSVIGLATAASPEGPWTEKGLVATSLNDNSRQTNAIDPTVVTAANGQQWMYYGSAWDGIYVLQLNPATGLTLNSGDKGKRIANRGFTGGVYNGNIEGPEVVYNSTLNKYFLFIAYDWLETKYNIRVMRGDRPDGPFYDFDGIDANTDADHGPMIVAPYRFNNHGGWQGVAHCAVFDDGNGQYYLAHQGRPGVNKYYMDLHVRKLFWTAGGWPVVSPERYAWEDNATVPQDSLAGNWEQVILGYRVVPGYAAEQVSPDFQTAIPLVLGVGGILNNDANSKWTYHAPWLQLNWSNGFTDQVLVQKGRDWENNRNTLIFTGLNNKGTAIWGKKN